MQSSEPEISELTEFLLNEILAQASASARGIILDSNVYEGEDENDKKIVQIT